MSQSRAKGLYLPMTREEADRFLEQGRILALATIGEDNWPHCAPVWYVYLDGKIYFRAQPYKKKIRNIASNPKVACSVEEGDTYSELRGVSIRGTARIVEEGAVKEKIEKRLLEKYAVQRRTDMMAEDWRSRHLSEKRGLVEVSIRHVSSWDNRKWVVKRD